MRHNDALEPASVAMDAIADAANRRCDSATRAANRIRMVSGAGHDAMILAEKVPAAMIFLRTPGGISHDPAETVRVEDVAKAIEAGSHLLAQLAASPAVAKENASCIILVKRAAPSKPNHLLLTPDTFVRAPLPGMKNCTAVVHVGPGAGRGVHAVHGRVRSRRRIGRHVGAAFSLRARRRRQSGSRRASKASSAARGYAYFPEGSAHRVVATQRRAAWPSSKKPIKRSHAVEAAARDCVERR